LADLNAMVTSGKIDFDAGTGKLSRLNYCMKTVTVDNYREDKYYPRVFRAVAKILSRSNVVTPVDVLMEMGNRTKQNYDAWRRGKLPYLEYVVEGNLSKVNRILRIIGFHLHDLNMVLQTTVYQQSDCYKNRVLQFTKFGIKRLEEAYSRHYVWNQSQEKKQQVVDRVITEYEA
jgi:hypothetical protein